MREGRETLPATDNSTPKEAPMKGDDDGRLVLQIFPRHAPDRAITYSGDQQHIRAVMHDIVQRLVDGGSPPLEVLDTDAESNGSAVPPVRVRELVQHLAEAGEDQRFTLEITPGAPDGRAFWAGGVGWYIAALVDTIAGGARMVGLLDENGNVVHPDEDPWDGRASAPVADLAEHLDDEDSEGGGADD